MTIIPNGTDICYKGNIQAKIGGYDERNRLYLVVNRSDGFPNEYSLGRNVVVGFCSVPTPPPIPDVPETIPGDRDADYPVTEKDAMTVFKTFAVAAVVIYAVVRIIWG